MFSIPNTFCGCQFVGRCVGRTAPCAAALYLAFGETEPAERFPPIRVTIAFANIAPRCGLLRNLTDARPAVACSKKSSSSRRRAQAHTDASLAGCRPFDAGRSLVLVVVETRGAALLHARFNATKGDLLMSGKPSHKVFVVEDREVEEGDDKDAFWTRVGSAWPHKDGKGLNVVLSALPVGNRLVLREYTAKDEKIDEEKAAKKKYKK
jgi:hypothetical protein